MMIINNHIKSIDHETCGCLHLTSSRTTETMPIILIGVKRFGIRFLVFSIREIFDVNVVALVLLPLLRQRASIVRGAGGRLGAVSAFVIILVGIFRICERM